MVIMIITSATCYQRQSQTCCQDVQYPSLTLTLTLADGLTLNGHHEIFSHKNILLALPRVSLA